MATKVCNLQIKKEEAVVPRGLPIQRSYAGPASSNLEQFTEMWFIPNFSNIVGQFQSLANISRSNYDRPKYSYARFM